MHRMVCWNERLEDGIRREIRVRVQRGEVRWQFKLSTDEKWDYDSPPFARDWDILLEKVENRYQRRNAPHADLELVRRLRQEALTPPE